MSAVDRIAKNPWPLVIGAAVIAGIAYFFGKQLLAGLGGLFTGNNALTEGTDYQGAGIAGTVGAAFDAASGGALSAAGSAIGTGLADLLSSSEYDGYSYSTSLHRWVQVIRRSDGKVFNVDAAGNITGAA